MFSLNWVILITLSSLIKNSLCQDYSSPTTTSPTTPSPTEELNDAEGFILLYSVEYVFVFLNLISVTFIMVRIYLRWHNNKRKFSMALRVPLYLGILDSLLVMLEIINIVYPTIYLKIIPDPYCSFIAGFNLGVIYFTKFMVAGIAIITYLRVCRKVYYDYGKYDWKIWLIAGTAAALITAPGYKNYGPAKYWCAARPNSRFAPIMSLVLAISVVGTCIFCYVSTIMEIRVVKKNTSAISNNGVNGNGVHGSRVHGSGVNSGGVNGGNSVNKNENATNNILSRTEQIEARVTRKVAGYILVFIIQWLPSFPYEICIIMNQKQIWTFVLLVIAFNLGGVGNAIFYVINEGWTSEGRDSTLDEESSATPISSFNKRIQTGREGKEAEAIQESPNARSKNRSLFKVSGKSYQNTSEITVVNVDVTTTTQITTIGNDKNV